jgi:hypothetical protein
MKLTDLIPGRSLQSKHAEAVEALRAAELAHAQAALAVESAGDGDKASLKSLETATKRLRDARQRVDDLAAAIDAQRRRDEDEARASAEAERERRWREVEKHTAAREQAAKDAEKHVAGLVKAIGSLHEASAAIWNASPVPLPPDAALLDRGMIDGAIRAAAIKAGLDLGLGVLPFPADVPTLSERVADANAYVGQVRSGRRTVSGQDADAF